MEKRKTMEKNEQNLLDKLYKGENDALHHTVNVLQQQLVYTFMGCCCLTDLKINVTLPVSLSLGFHTLDCCGGHAF